MKNGEKNGLNFKPHIAKGKRMEQKCTIQHLINILNKITRALGYGRIEEITLRSGSTEHIKYSAH